MRYLSQFAIPPQYENEFLDQIVVFDSDAEIYQADEITLPFYNFRLLLKDVRHDQQLWSWIALLKKGIFPETPQPQSKQIEFDSNTLQLLHYKVNGLSRSEIMEKMGISDKREYETSVKKLKKDVYEDTNSVNSIEKLLIIIKKPVKKFDNLTIMKSFYELFIYSHNFQIIKKYPKTENMENVNGILSIIMPMTPHIPLFHDTICDIFGMHCFLTIIDAFDDLFNLGEVYNQTEGNWIWDKNCVRTVQ